MKVRSFSRDNFGFATALFLFKPIQYRLHPMHQRKTTIGANSSEIILFLTGIICY